MSRRLKATQVLPTLALLLPLTVPAALPTAAVASTTITATTAPGARDAKTDAALLKALLDKHIQPRVNGFAAAAAGLPTALNGFCAAPDDKGLTAVRQAYTQAMLAWAGIQHLKPGPLGLELRSERIAFWPDKRSVGTRQMAQALSRKDPAPLEPGGMTRQSAALQGLPAVERLLFDDGINAASFTGDAGSYRCKLAAAAAANVATLAKDVADGWVELGPKLLTGEETTVGKGPTEALNALYLAMLTAVQTIEDQKLRIPLGNKPDEAKPALAESVKSGLSLKLMAENIRALRSAILGDKDAPGFVTLLAAKDAEATTAKLTKAFDGVAAAVAAVPEPLDAAVAEGTKRAKAEAALKAAKVLQGLIATELPPLIGITVGFNELDGD